MTIRTAWVPALYLGFAAYGVYSRDFVGAALCLGLAELRGIQIRLDRLKPRCRTCGGTVETGLCSWCDPGDVRETVRKGLRRLLDEDVDR